MKNRRTSFFGRRIFPRAKTYGVAMPLFLGFVMSLFLAGTAAGTGVIMRVSTDAAGAQADGYSVSPSISADGRYVAFSSYASNLVPGDTNGVADIFLKDALNGTVSLVSRDDSGALRNSDSFDPTISADGRYVAFASNALVGDLPNVDIFIKDTLTGAVNEFRCSDCDYYHIWQYSVSDLSISGDGRYVAYEKKSCVNTWQQDDNGWILYCDQRSEVFDTQAQGSPYKSIDGQHPSISADGRYVAFSSYPNPVPGDTYGASDIFVEDTVSGSITNISADADGNQNTLRTGSPSISGDGRYVAFVQGIPDPPLSCLDCNDIFVKDTVTGTRKWVSTDSTGTAGFLSYNGPPSISADGRFVAFASTSEDLVAGDTNGVYDVFAKDTLTGAITSLSSDSAGFQGSVSPSISADGGYVAFASDASNLVPDDSNQNPDIFLAALPACSGNGRPELTLSRTGASWASYPDYLAGLLSVGYGIDNGGGNTAYAVTIAGAVSSNGVTTAAIMAPAGNLGDISPGTGGNTTIKYNVPSGVASFKSTVYASAMDGCGNSYSYPGPYPRT